MPKTGVNTILREPRNEWGFLKVRVQPQFTLLGINHPCIKLDRCFVLLTRMHPYNPNLYQLIDIM